MTRRNGASLVNVMVFVLFAMMVTAQVFFYTTTSFESLSDEREIMGYRLMLDSIVRLASADLALEEGQERSITHRNGITADYKSFYGNTQVAINNMIQSWDISDYPSEYHATIHDLDYSFDATFEPEPPYSDGRTTWEKRKYDSDKIYEKVFAAMNPPVMVGDVATDADGNITTVYYRYYLLRAYAELPKDKFYGRKLMYQVLFRRDNENSSLATHKVYMQSFQEIWF
ncbi:MAG: hypothetical protein IJP89_12185 [Synergistaceae bacterium]|nr:hypothetical protein [Synergistaceae bacterium]